MYTVYVTGVMGGVAYPHTSQVREMVTVVNIVSIPVSLSQCHTSTHMYWVDDNQETY